jgi:NAD(P)H-dependent FMN reductase
MTRLLLLCGSQRPASLNARLLGELARYIPTTITADLVNPGEIDLPLFDQDLENHPAIHARVKELHARFAAADAIILASPEYNGLMTPYLKNIVDWISRLPRLDPAAPNAFLDKPVLLASASPGWSGGGLGIIALRMLFGHVGAVPFGETICLPYADQAWDAEGKLNPMLGALGWHECVARFCAFIDRPHLLQGQAA